MPADAPGCAGAKEVLNSLGGLGLIILFKLKNLLKNRARDAEPAAAVPAGERVYAIGDVHGRLDLFERLIAAIEDDDAAREPAATTIVLLGDLVDRGPDSAGVVAAARRLAERRRVRLISGNHEEMLLRAAQDARVLPGLLRYGGRETLLSYGVDPGSPDDVDGHDEGELEALRVALAAALPDRDLAFLQAAEDMVRIGDYAFVHAGIRPGLPLDEQSRRDLRWIREPFLSHAESHGAVVVHGHTITAEPEFRPNRIGIDTGAFSSGRLTALALQGTARWLIETSTAEGGEIACRTRSMA